ncbi:MAG: cyclic nucleotide-binding domain-containing protein, partial [Spirochaetia bacterium]|nr:cyclic nucleotide-binding domain-containing protein [Spirochaetia bacterium]
MSEDRQFKAGEIIFTQNTIPDMVAILQSGTVELLSASDDYNDLDTQIMLRHSSKVMPIKEPGIIAGHSRLLSEKCSKSVRALTNCSISVYPFSSGFEGIAASDPNTAATILRQIYNRINSAAAGDQKFGKLYQNICVISDNISLMYSELGGSGAPATLESKASSLYQNFSSGSASFPEQFSAKFLVTDNSRSLSRRYGLPGEAAEAILQKDLALIKQLLSMNKQIFTEMIKSEKNIAVNICETLTDVYSRIISRVESAKGLINKELYSMFGPENSWSDYLVNGDGFDQWKNSNKLSEDFIKNFLSLIIKLNAIYEEIIGEKLTAGYPGIKMIHDYYTSAGAKPQETEPQPAAVVQTSLQQPAGNIADLKNSLSTIFNFTLVDKDFQTRFLKM